MRWMKWICLVFSAIAIGFGTSACEVNQYDDLMARCEYSNGKIDVEVLVYRDSDQQARRFTPGTFFKACSLIKKSNHWSSVDASWAKR